MRDKYKSGTVFKVADCGCHLKLICTSTYSDINAVPICHLRVRKAKCVYHKTQGRKTLSISIVTLQRLHKNKVVRTLPIATLEEVKNVEYL